MNSDQFQKKRPNEIKRRIEAKTSSITIQYQHFQPSFAMMMIPNKQGLIVEMQPEQDITKILFDIQSGVTGASDRLLPIVYDQLRVIVSRIYASRQKQGASIQPTILVHDAFMKLTRNTDIDWESRSHFFAVAAKVTRNLLVDYARRRTAAKRGGGWNRISLNGIQDAQTPERMIDVIDLEEALQQLAESAPRQERIVEMRFYGGLTVEEIAQILGVSERTVSYDWRMARAWLRTQLEVRQE